MNIRYYLFHITLIELKIIQITIMSYKFGKPLQLQSRRTHNPSPLFRRTARVNPRPHHTCIPGKSGTSTAQSRGCSRRAGPHCSQAVCRQPGRCSRSRFHYKACTIQARGRFPRVPRSDFPHLANEEEHHVPLNYN